MTSSRVNDCVLRLVFGVVSFGCGHAEALEWQRIEGGRYAPVAFRTPGKAGFETVNPAESGVIFTNWCAPERHLTNQILLNGAGVAAGDVDGDGWCDLYFCGLDGPNALYRNLGNWKFADVTAQAGVACTNVDATGAAFADIDGDSDLDLLVNTIGSGTFVFFNNGKGKFSEQATAGRLNGTYGGTSLTLGDVDGDGDLDLYVANYRTVTLRDQPNTRFTFRIVDGKPQVTSVNDRPLTDPHLTNRFTFRINLKERGGSFGQEENGEPDQLFQNDGAGRFTPVPWTDGRFLDEQGKPLQSPPYDWGLSVLCRDLNGDGAPDLYVCNDFRSPDRMWINNGLGVFRATAPLTVRQTCLSTMGLDVADLNRDGHEDILLLDMLSREHQRRFSQRIDIRPEALPIGAIDNRPQYPRNMLLLNRGDGTYAEIAQFSGLDATEWSWTPAFLDVDLDGWEDLLVTTGFERDNMNVDLLREIESLKKQKRLTPLEQLRLRKMFPRLELENLAFRNERNLKFTETGAAWGFAARGISQAMVLADLDNDGDLDCVMNNFNAVAGLLRNTGGGARIAVRLRGEKGNTQGIGARLRLTGGAVPQTQQVVCGGRYLGADENLRVFAAGTGTNRLDLEVLWRSGKRSFLSGVLPNRIYEVDEARASRTTSANAPESPTFFEDVSELVAHEHVEGPFDDLARQPLLSKRLSQLGPGLAWFDLDGDTRDELVIGSGAGGKVEIRSPGRTPPQVSGLAPVNRDTAGILGLQEANGPAMLLVAESSYENGPANVPAVQEFRAGAAAIPIPAVLTGSAGPMALADVDGDGDLDLFVGGRVAPGRYPEPTQSLLLRRVERGWQVDTENTNALAQASMVSGAVFSDLDEDGFPELVLACEWGPLRVFQNRRGRFEESTSKWGLDRFPGWWNGVNAGDFDGDGRLDLVAANWGRNTKYEFSRREGLRMVYGDVDGNGSVESLEAYLDPKRKEWRPLQPFHVVVAALPQVGERVGTATAFAAANFETIYGDVKGFPEVAATCLDSMVFLNRGGKFEARALPDEAQFTPAFAACVSDLDGDGHEDVFLSQNFFAVAPDISRHDAGRGLWLRGDGSGGFTSVPGQRSGLLVYGEQRGAALCDYDVDGRVDLAVSQNGAQTKLFRNRLAAAGLRVRLRAGANNPHGIGAVLRGGSKNSPGPAREIHAGSGYWSQDSPVQVISGRTAYLRLIWPGGVREEFAVPNGAREVLVEPGKISVPPTR